MISALAWIAATSVAWAEPFTAKEVAQVDRIVSEAMAEVDTPSASVAVVRQGEIVFAKAYGLRQLDPAKPASTDTRYRIASVSKQFTAAAVLMLADEGKLSLNDPLRRYLPELGVSDTRTVRQALTHTGGFRDFWTTDFPPDLVRTPTSPQAIVDRWGRAAPDFAPGSAWAYSNTGYVVLGRLVERVSGRPLAVFLKRRVFVPLKMTSASDVDELGPRGDDATGHERAAAGPPREAFRVAAGWTFACGELSMTVTDLARWDVSILRRTLMSPAAYDAMATEEKLTDGSETGYGLGVFVDTFGGHRRLRHNGDLPGFWTENRIYPDDGAAIVVMVNGSYGGSPHAVIANGIEQMLLRSEESDDAAARPQTPKQALQTLVRQIRDDRLDRSNLSADANAYLSGAVLADYRESFRRLGPALAAVPQGERSENGIQVGTWLLVWPDVKLLATVRLSPDQKVEEFLAFPVWQRRGGAAP